MRLYLPVLTATPNRKGVLDIDTVKGCALGMKANPAGGCYGECYAAKTAARYGIDFSTSILRRPGRLGRYRVLSALHRFPANWYRVGTAGDPCHAWDHTLSVCEWLQPSRKAPVIITKHWIELADGQINRLRVLGAIVNTSTSGLDSDSQVQYRVKQIERLREAGVRSVNRVVTCSYGNTDFARTARDKQEYLLSIRPVIDTPLRASRNSALVRRGIICTETHPESIGGGKTVSLHSQSAYLGACRGCPDQCGVNL